MAQGFQVTFHEDASVTVLARLTSRTGSGASTGVDGEGDWLQQADFTSITYKVFDLYSATPNTEINSGTLTLATVILDSPVDDDIWTADNTGYNFIHEMAATEFPTGGHIYRVEYEATLTGGGKFHGAFEGEAEPIRGS